MWYFMLCNNIYHFSVLLIISWFFDALTYFLIIVFFTLKKMEFMAALGLITPQALIGKSYKYKI